VRTTAAKEPVALTRSFALGHKTPVVAVEPHPDIEKKFAYLRVEHKGAELAVLPHDLLTTIRLRQLGYDVPSPILRDYNWAGAVPFEPQKVTAAMLTLSRRAYVLSQMGTGKSLASLFAYDYMHSINVAKKLLIVAPLSTLDVVWGSEVFNWMPWLKTSVLHGTKPQRYRALDKDVDIYIINHDGVAVLQDALAERKDINTVILDELAVYRNRRTKLWNSANRLIEPRAFVWGMTGGPTPKAPTDAWAQVRLLTPNNITWSFTRFRDETMVQNGPFKWRERPEALSIVHKAMQPAVRFRRSECVDLPPTTYSERAVDLTPEQKKVYAAMKNDFYLQHPKGEVTAVNAGVQINKLMQICCGFVYGKKSDGETGVMIELDNKPRINTMLEIIEEAASKVIIYVPYIKAVSLVERALQGQYTFGTVTGDISRVTSLDGTVEQVRRSEVFARFQKREDPHVLVAHPKVAAHGLTLTAADTILWYGLLPDLDIYDQACARVARPGQKLHTHIIHLVSMYPERKVSKVLKERGNLQAALLHLFNEDGR
jgi:SNF2 family DNA or RNA helicase